MNPTLLTEARDACTRVDVRKQVISYLPGEREGKLVNRLASSLSLCHSRSFSFTQYACLSLSLSLSFWQSKSHHSFPLRPSSLLSCCGSVFISPSPLISSSRGQGLQEHHHTRLMSLVCVDVVSLFLEYESLSLFLEKIPKEKQSGSCCCCSCPSSPSLLPLSCPDERDAGAAAAAAFLSQLDGLSFHQRPVLLPQRERGRR